MNSAGNIPPQPPLPPESGNFDLAEAESIRRAHIRHEASIKSIGILYLLGALILATAAVIALFDPQPSLGAKMTTSLACLALAGLQIWVALGLRQLRRPARIATIVLSTIGLLGVPIGTIINAYVLYLMLSRKGRTIFAPDYQTIIAATPEIRYRTSIIVWIALGLLLLAALFLIGAGFFSQLMKHA